MFLKGLPLTIMLLSSLLSSNTSISFIEEIRQWINPTNIIAEIKPTNFSLDEATSLFNQSITISASGDVTIGSDEKFGYHGTFIHEADKQGFSYFGENVKSIFEEDDLTIVNLETTLTNATSKANKQFTFKGDPSYAEILKQSSIEAVNLANNHTLDFLEQGFMDTKKTLEEYDIAYFGYEDMYLEEINGIKVGNLGYKGWHDDQSVRDQIEKDIKKLRDDGAQIIIVSFHWGEERHYHPNATQQALGRFTIDAGADLVLGHHPHVVQGIEEYKDKYIVYSLGNFMFGGNRNPGDKDTFIFQQTFHFSLGQLTDKKDISIIPTSISSVNNRNNYQPTPLVGKEADRVIDKILELSAAISDNNIQADVFRVEGNIAHYASK